MWLKFLEFVKRHKIIIGSAIIGVLIICVLASCQGLINQNGENQNLIITESLNNGGKK